MFGVVAGEVAFWNTVARGDLSWFWAMLSRLEMMGLEDAALEMAAVIEGEIGDDVVSVVALDSCKWFP